MDNIVYLEDYYKSILFERIQAIVDTLIEDYSVSVIITSDEIDLIISSFYSYYESKNIIFSYLETMTNHFSDICFDVIEEEKSLTLDFVLKKLKLYELMESQVEVNPLETSQLIKKIRKELMDRR